MEESQIAVRISTRYLPIRTRLGTLHLAPETTSAARKYGEDPFWGVRFESSLVR